jgi:hypothetical protein
LQSNLTGFNLKAETQWQEREPAQNPAAQAWEYHAYHASKAEAEEQLLLRARLAEDSLTHRLQQRESQNEFPKKKLVWLCFLL